MRARAIAALGSLSDDGFFRSVGEGLRLIEAHACALSESAAALSAQGRGRAARILDTVAAEEAAKYLILLDAVRCPPFPQKRRVQQLDHFNSHLSKGIYATLARFRPADFAETIRSSELLRKEFYLDGPNEVDWIFRNQIVAEREEALYVDFVDAEGDLKWWAPSTIFDDPVMTRTHVEPDAVRLVRSMGILGFHELPVLRSVGKTWRTFDPVPETRRTDLQGVVREMLGGIEIEESAVERAQHAAQIVVESWTFPLWNQDLSVIPVDRQDLEDERNSFDPGW